MGHSHRILFEAPNKFLETFAHQIQTQSKTQAYRVLYDRYYCCWGLPKQNLSRATWNHSTTLLRQIMHPCNIGRIHVWDIVGINIRNRVIWISVSCLAAFPKRRSCQKGWDPSEVTDGCHALKTKSTKSLSIQLNLSQFVSQISVLFVLHTTFSTATQKTCWRKLPKNLGLTLGKGT